MTHFASSLRTWRKTRRFSQLDLALEADVSARHISFLETGRAQPSRDMIFRLGDALQLPLTACNQLLTHAGFAARYPARDWEDADMAPIRAAVSHMLDGHSPYPALALDRNWTVLKMNDPAQRLFGALGVTMGVSLLDRMLEEDVPALIDNWPAVAHHAARRLRTESTAQGGNPRLDQAAEILSQAPAPELQTTNPVVPTVFALPGLRLSLFATIAQFGTPDDLLLDDLKIELYFPADEASKSVLMALG